MEANHIIEIHRLKKHFGNLEVLRILSFIKKEKLLQLLIKWKWEINSYVV